MKVTKEELNQVLKKFPKTYNRWLEGDIDNLFGAIDLNVYHAEGLNIYELEDGIEFEPEDLKYIKSKAELEDEDHIKWYQDHGFFHDGGDDLDYGGSFVRCLIDLISEVFDCSDHQRV